MTAPASSETIAAPAAFAAQQHGPHFGPIDWTVIVLINLMWGLNIIAAKMAVDQISPMTAAFSRQMMIATLCLPWLRVVPGRMVPLLGFGICTGVLFFIPLNFALKIAHNVGALAICGQLGTPLAVVLSVILLRERIGIIRTSGIALAFVGVIVMGFDPRLANDVPALCLSVLASFAWAGGSLVTRSLTGVPVLTMYAWSGLTGALVMGAVALVVEPGTMAQLNMVSASTWGWVLFSAVGSTLIGSGGLSWMIQRHSVSAVVPYTLITPLVSVIVSSIMFATPITVMMMVGGAVMLIGVAIVTIRSASKGVLIVEEGS